MARRQHRRAAHCHRIAQDQVGHGEIGTQRRRLAVVGLLSQERDRQRIDHPVRPVDQGQLIVARVGEADRRL